MEFEIKKIEFLKNVWDIKFSLLSFSKKGE